MTSTLTIVDLALAAFAIYLIEQLLSRRRLALPPGPRGFPLIGNVLDMPQAKESEVFSEWGKRFGAHIPMQRFCRR